MSDQLLAVGSLFAIGLIWLLVNIKTNHTSATKTISLALAYMFLLAGSVAAVGVAWGALS